MSMLDRYRKPGGFAQLLALIETCTEAKQIKLLDIIAQEDRRWSETVRAKMLSIDRIYAWQDDVLAEIFGSLQDLTVSVAFHGANDTMKNRIRGFSTHARMRKIEDLKSSNGPTPAEIVATHMKIVECVRKMGSDGFLRFEKIDPTLVIGEAIDDMLSGPAPKLEPVSSRQAVPQSQSPVPGQPQPRVLHSYSPLAEHVAARTESETHAPAYMPSHAKSDGSANESRLAELHQLKQRVADLSKENATLRHELSIAKSKLDQIKKIA